MISSRLCLAVTTIVLFLYSLGLAQDTTVTVNELGNVGIGTTDPTELLDIAGGSMKISNGGETNATVFRPFIFLNHTGMPAQSIADFGGGLVWQKEGESQLEMFYTHEDTGLVIWHPQLGPRHFIHARGSMWADGMIESRRGGFKFPDGSIQTTAAGGGSTTGDGHSLDASDGDPADVVFADANGNVGVHTQEPSNTLHVNGTLGAEGVNGLFRVHPFFNPLANTTLLSSFIGYNNFAPQVRFATDSPDFIDIGQNADGSFVVENGFDSAQLVVTQRGNVGLGTTAPNERLQIGDFGTGDIYLAIKSIGGNQARNGIKFRNFNDDYGWTIQNDERLGSDGLNFISHFDDSLGTSRMFLGKFGNVGIGTATPAHALDVKGDLSIGSGTQRAILHFDEIDGAKWTMSTTGFKLSFNNDSDVSRMVIEQDGNVGIGTTAPTEMLQVGDFDLDSNNYIAVKTAGGQIYESGIKLLHFNEEAGFTIYSDDGSASGAIGLHIKRHHGTFPEGGIQTMTIDRLTGNIGFGTTRPNHPLEMASGAHVTAGGVWTDASSRQFKENIRSLGGEEALIALEQLNPVKFHYRTERDEEYLGFIAEDVPDLVATKARKSLSPMDIVAVLTKVVQQQQKKIAELEARLDAGH